MACWYYKYSLSLGQASTKPIKLYLSLLHKHIHKQTQYTIVYV